VGPSAGGTHVHKTFAQPLTSARHTYDTAILVVGRVVLVRRPLRMARQVLIRTLVAFVVRVLLWLLLLIAPGGILLLPIVLGDAVVRRRKQEQEAAKRSQGLAASPVVVEPAPASSPCR
jgi:hypothetical protein